ncbi:hypothetical protein KC19_12G183000 [Ceratodon purpureus]|uniref:RING-type E3 ubiquitin transferase n=1 Tax=Ceratodon purpureus TaxID=3225 RepID=A0A8T0GAY1_CERPU|nr:hypothetical protein KC19_12G183000 [Ceratodon purpureus]KAG0555627.1 hypothetical protein KC19_12G183000 [Ceratodon purpureus]
MTTAGADEGQAGESSHKRKREPGLGGEKDVKRKYDLDTDILDCSICLERFSTPVYQCPNGHTACAACCKKLDKCPTCSLPTGRIRSIAIEKILESLLVSCKYARHGCEVMRKPTLIEMHEERYCSHKPSSCPIAECDFEGTDAVLLVHLAERHQVRTIAHDNITPQWFTMEPSDRIVILRIVEARDIQWETYPFYFVHHEVHETLGDVFYCTSFGGSSEAQRYSLQVKIVSRRALYYTSCFLHA